METVDMKSIAAVEFMLTAVSVRLLVRWNDTSVNAVNYDNVLIHYMLQVKDNADCISRQIFLRNNNAVTCC